MQLKVVCNVRPLKRLGVGGCQVIGTRFFWGGDTILENYLCGKDTRFLCTEKVFG